jgi:glycosyltransferase involved in cell wall biosynthesis
MKKSTKSVCMVVQNPYEIDIRVRRKAEALVAAGYRVDAIALRSSHSPAKTYRVDGVTVHTISLGKMRGSLLRYLFEYVAFFTLSSIKLSRLMRRRHYSVIDINTLPDFLVFAGWYTKLKGAKIVLDMHELTPEFFMSKYGVERKHWLVRLAQVLERASFAYADRVITINEPVQELFESRGLKSGKSIVMMNAADDSLFDAVHEGSEARDPKKFVMMYHGTLTKIYGLDIAMEAFGMAHKNMPGAEFWIIGDGPEKDNLQRFSKEMGVESKVRFIGRVLPEQIVSWLKQCDAGVLATRSDVFLDYSFSNKLTEYIIMKKAVIVSRLRTIRHYFSEEALAFFEPNQPSGLAKQMVRLYQEKGLRSRLAEKAREEYDPISWTVMKRRYLKVVNGMADVEEKDNSDHAEERETPVLAAK